MDKKSRQILKKYLKTEGRLEKQLVTIVAWVKKQTLDTFVRQLEMIISEPLNWDHFFKILIMLNNLIVNQQINLNSAFNILIKMTILKFENNDFQNILINDLLQPYRLYLQKRCLLDIMEQTIKISERTQTPQKDSKSFCNPESNQEISIQQQQGGQELCKLKHFYRYLNLLKAGSNFSPMIFILARYYPKKILYIPDFNIAWAADISLIYYYFNLSLSRPYQESQLIQVELLHQTLYNVFYNTYFANHLKKFVPKWIKTDHLELDIQTTKNKQLDRTNDKTPTNNIQQWNQQQLQHQLSIFQDLTPNKRYLNEQAEQIESFQRKFQLITSQFIINDRNKL